MSKPKKPGTDLAALKARLAKKTKGTDAPSAGAPAQQDVPPPGAPPMEVPPPGEVVQHVEAAAPAMPYVPPPGQVADVPPPGQVADVPPPGQVAQPREEYPPAVAAQVPTAPAVDPDDPFGGGVGTFDPTEGIIDSGGDIPSRGNTGLVAVAGIGGILFGVAIGWLVQSNMGTRERLEIGKKKGQEMVTEVTAISESRKGVALAWEDIQKKLKENPEQGAADLEALLAQHFDKHPKIDSLFGWQLASVHSQGIRRTFELYEETNRLRTDLGYLAAFVKSQAAALGEAGGPTIYGTMQKSNGSVLVAIAEPLCGELGDNGDTSGLKTCGDPRDAVAFRVQVDVGAEPVVALRGTEEGQVVLLLPEGLYGYAIGQNPANNAKVIRDAMIGRVSERLEAMNKAEQTALTALSNYAENPTVDDSTVQPAPEGE